MNLLWKLIDAGRYAELLRELEYCIPGSVLKFLFKKHKNGEITTERVYVDLLRSLW